MIFFTPSAAAEQIRHAEPIFMLPLRCRRRRAAAFAIEP
jgi:hypothetical protein